MANPVWFPGVIASSSALQGPWQLAPATCPSRTTASRGPGAGLVTACQYVFLLRLRSCRVLRPRGTPGKADAEQNPPRPRPPCSWGLLVAQRLLSRVSEAFIGQVFDVRDVPATFMLHRLGPRNGIPPFAGVLAFVLANTMTAQVTTPSPAPDRLRGPLRLGSPSNGERVERRPEMARARAGPHGPGISHLGPRPRAPGLRADGSSYASAWLLARSPPRASIEA